MLTTDFFFPNFFKHTHGLNIMLACNIIPDLYSFDDLIENEISMLLIFITNLVIQKMYVIENMSSNTLLSLWKVKHVNTIRRALPHIIGWESEGT